MTQKCKFLNGESAPLLQKKQAPPRIYKIASADTAAIPRFSSDSA